MATNPSSAEEHREYYYLQGVVGGLNADCLEIKKWSVAAASALAVIGQSTDLKPFALAILIAFLGLAFWITETVWRINQWAFIRRVQEMEAADARAPRISHGWVRHYEGKTKLQDLLDHPEKHWKMDQGESQRWFRHFRAPRTWLPHGMTVGLAAMAAIAIHLGWVSSAAKPATTNLSGSLDVRVKR